MDATTFTLRIRFMGLGLFIPDGDRMHVLLPDTSGCHDVHDARIYVDGDSKGEPFGDVRWDLTSLSAGTVDLELPEALPNPAAALRREGIARDQVKPGQQKNVHSHVILGAGRWVRRGPTANFRFLNEEGQEEGGVFPATNWLDWEIAGITGSKLPAFTKLSDPSGDPGSAPEVRDQLVKVEIVYAPGPDHPNRYGSFNCEDYREKGGEHFTSYYRLFEQESRRRPKVICGRREGSAVNRNRTKMLEPIVGGKVYTCMLAQSTIDPNS